MSVRKSFMVDVVPTDPSDLERFNKAIAIVEQSGEAVELIVRSNVHVAPEGPVSGDEQVICVYPRRYPVDDDDAGLALIRRPHNPLADRLDRHLIEPEGYELRQEFERHVQEANGKFRLFNRTAITKMLDEKPDFGVRRGDDVAEELLLFWIRQQECLSKANNIYRREWIGLLRKPK